jgi:hypothetical protein
VFAPGSYDAIHINVPKVFRRTGESYQVPYDLSHMGKVHIFELERDYGPATKLLPTLQRVNESSERSLIITLDDDIAYDCDLIYQLLRAQRLVDWRVVVGMSGLADEKDLSFRSSAKSRHTATEILSQSKIQGRPVDILEGLGLVCYPSWLIDHKFLTQCIDSCPACFTSDDLVISFLLNESHIPRIEIPYERGFFPFLSYGV